MFEGQGHRSTLKVTWATNVANVVGIISSEGFLVF